MRSTGQRSCSTLMVHRSSWFGTLSARPTPDERVTACQRWAGQPALDLPDFRNFGLTVDSPGAERAESTRQLGTMLAEIYRRNPDRFRLFLPMKPTATG